MRIIMQYKVKALLLTALVGILSGCNYITGGADNSTPPMALTKIKPEQEFQQLWSVKTGKGTRGSYLKLKPLIINDKIATIDAEGLLQLRQRADGKLLWQKDLKQRITQGVSGNHQQLLVSTAYGKVIVLDATNGNELWQHDLEKTILNNPLLAGKDVFIQTADGILYSLNSSTGKLNWEYKFVTPDLTLYTTASPIVWKDTVIAGFASGKVAAFSRETGMPLWERQIADSSGSSIIKRMVDIGADPLIYNGILYVVSYQGNIKAINLTNGHQEWTHELSAISNIAANNKHLYISDTEGTVWALNRLTGRVLWKQDHMQMRDLSGVAYSDKTIVVGDYEGYLHGLADNHGDFIARTKLSSSGIRVAPQVKNGIIYILDNSGTLAAYKLQAVKTV